jgi:hypothetical protein
MQGYGLHAASAGESEEDMTDILTRWTMYRASKDYRCENGHAIPKGEKYVRGIDVEMVYKHRPQGGYDLHATRSINTMRLCATCYHHPGLR